MKAVLCKEYGPPEKLVIEDVPSPEPKDGEVVIEVHSAAVNFPDVLIIQNLYQFKPPLPFSPGGEVSGKVTKVGAGVKKIKVGDRVIGSCGWGGFAEEIALEEARALPIPDEMDYETASAFLMTYGTSHHALKDRAEIKPGETLVVLGAAGGVGLAAVELGKAMGAKVIAGASSEDKVAVAKEHGADDGFVYPSGPLDRDQQKALSEKIKELTGGQGADVLYDPVGGDYAEPALRAMNWNGRYLVVGFAAGDIPKIPLNLALLKGCQIVGVFWGAFTGRERARHEENLRELMEMFKAGKIKPHVSKSYKLEDVASALNDMAGRKVKGKVVLRVR
ncbi:alcohol dehydrogenase [Tepidicaulis marinus]|uniref:Alcohol dehydrogenase n=1 Tax=Tepidicaulis marinus TaxID=1333998 RepID=A0A081B852_9HYPH|nr:NADPH:quinone oxidoreductase family protein [Tepidicaulis marinus]GAK44220.1 alcohol dehydrogenase [Tepidicaulis marinus]